MDPSIPPLELFRRTARTVPAYRRFLKSAGVAPASIRRGDWDKVPLTEKATYLAKYPLKELFSKGKMPAFAYASSGSSGTPTFWFRGDSEERRAADVHERIFAEMFGIKKREDTLLVVCFSMGVWVAGNLTAAAGREMSRRGYAMTTITPGLEQEDIFHSLQALAPRFHNVILAGYPPFLMDVIMEARRRNIRLPRLFALTAGDRFSEEWRDSFLEVSGMRAPEHLVSIYGSADAGVMGHETPLTIHLRRRAVRDPALYAKLFGEAEPVPAFVQYDPAHIFFETQGSDLVLTTDSALPLVRYNIHDQGAVHSFEEMKKMLGPEIVRDLRRKKLLHGNMPFLVKTQRSDVAVTFYALNVYPDHLKAGAEDPKVRRFLSGQFFAFNQDTEGGRRQTLHIQVELAPGVRPSGLRVRAIRDSIVRNLTAMNIEYRKLRTVLGDRALPVIETFLHGEFKRRPVRGILAVRGKKMKMTARPVR